MTTGEISTRGVTIPFRQTLLDEAARLMRENHVGCLVVVDEMPNKRTVIGLLTERDIVTAVVAEDMAPSAPRMARMGNGARPQGRRKPWWSRGPCWPGKRRSSIK